uniref:RanBD1 domain-containing protein n=1 Tax=Syphacia muris TaxID=451379 RepID=A0A0N5ANI7_9BILA
MMRVFLKLNSDELRVEVCEMRGAVLLVQETTLNWGEGRGGEGAFLVKDLRVCYAKCRNDKMIAKKGRDLLMMIIPNKD